MFFEPDRIYRSMKSDVVDDGIGLPLDVCFTLRPGRDLTVVAWGACIQEVMRAANLLAEQDIQCEVLDLATIKPLDMESILASVRKTGRLLVVHEACGSFGVGAEIVARVTEEALTSLKAPPRRLTGVDAAVPYYRNEEYYLITEQDIADAAHQLMENQWL